MKLALERGTARSVSDTSEFPKKPVSNMTGRSENCAASGKHHVENSRRRKSRRLCRPFKSRGCSHETCPLLLTFASGAFKNDRAQMLRSALRADIPAAAARELRNFKGNPQIFWRRDLVEGETVYRRNLFRRKLRSDYLIAYIAELRIYYL